ncbi:MAG: hypothetical protein KA821_19840 [Chitinophagaceae bacterium]|nr:hypothetical protein [Chitinophagaceae bacterium]
MNQEELRAQFLKYAYKSGMHEKYEVLGMFANHFLTIVQLHHKDPVTTVAEKEAKIVLQMMATKVLYLMKTIDGVSFNTRENVLLNNIIDPSIIAGQVRNVFETAGMFNTIYRGTQTDEDRKLVHLLWVSAGLKYRQRFVTNIITPEIKKKQEDEEKKINDITNEIVAMNLYQGLDAKNQEKIQNRIKNKEYLVKIENNKVAFLTWSDVSTSMGMDEKLFSNMYTYFSLYAHPSNVSVFQFAEMFNGENPGYIGLTEMNLTYAIFFFSVFLADYIHLFPKVKETFEKLPLIQQLILNAPNRLARGSQFSINDSHKALG